MTALLFYGKQPARQEAAASVRYRHQTGIGPGTCRACGGNRPEPGRNVGR